MLTTAVSYNFGKFVSNDCFNGLPKIFCFTLTTNDPIIGKLCDWSSNLHRATQAFLSLIYLSWVSLIDSCHSKTESFLWISGQSFGCHSIVENDRMMGETCKNWRVPVIVFLKCFVFLCFPVRNLDHFTKAWLMLVSKHILIINFQLNSFTPEHFI